MKKASIVLFSALFIVSANAAKTGIGISASQDGGGIYVPINISERFRLEPTFSIQYSESESDEGYSYKSSGYELALGIFGQTSVLEHLKTYYGARIGYVYFRRENDDPVYPTPYESEEHGVQIIPTLGVEYFFHKQVSIGGEVGWYFRYIDENGSDASTRKSTGSITQLIARFYF